LLIGLQALPAWNEYFDHPRGTLLGLVTAAIMFPGIVAGFPAAWICMHWGHRWCVMIGCILTIIGAIWIALAPNMTHFIVGKLALLRRLAKLTHLPL